MKSQHAAGTTVLNDFNPVAGACERPPNCAKITRSYKESFTATFSILLTKKGDLKNRCDALVLE